MTTHNAENNLALHVHACVIIPTELRSRYPKAHKHDGRINPRLRRKRLIAHRIVFTVSEPNGATLFWFEGEAGFRGNYFHPDKTDFLQIAARIARRPQSI